VCIVCIKTVFIYPVKYWGDYNTCGANEPFF
jgi:hypothetical protein